MRIKLEIKTEGKERINAEVVYTINEVIKEMGYKNTSFEEYRICDICEARLSEDYPEENDLCTNCESRAGYQ
jgi:hypothetical protein